MERLTKVDDQGRLLAYSISDTGLPAIFMSGNPYREIIDRLKAYEDTGLEPEEVRELVTALRSMKAVVLTGADAEEWIAYQDGKH